MKFSAAFLRYQAALDREYEAEQRIFYAFRLALLEDVNVAVWAKPDEFTRAYWHVYEEGESFANGE